MINMRFTVLDYTRSHPLAALSPLHAVLASIHGVVGDLPKRLMKANKFAPGPAQPLSLSRG